MPQGKWVNRGHRIEDKPMGRLLEAEMDQL